jgi:hypothetical protein
MKRTSRKLPSKATVGLAPEVLGRVRGGLVSNFNLLRPHEIPIMDPKPDSAGSPPEQSSGPSETW